MSLLINFRSTCQSCRITLVAYHHRRSLWTSRQKYNKSHYQTLELSSEATHADIKTAYYKLSMKFHPDKQKGNEDIFKELTTAYEVLGNPRLRRLYDRGIISHDHASIQRYSDQDDSVAIEEQSENTKASVRSFDKWSRTHYSTTFARSQEEKYNRTKYKNIRETKKAQAGTEGTVMMIGLLLIVGTMYLSLKSLPGNSKKKV